MKEAGMHVHPEWFRDWFDSPYYHKLYFERDESEATAFIQRLLDRLRPKPGSRMLDVGCGRGRHSRILAGNGFDVTGIDLAPQSIAYAQVFAYERLHFYVHDMRLPFWINYFDYAFNLFTSFGYFRTEREDGNALRSICRSLHPKGTFVIDYLNTYYAAAHLEPRADRLIGGTTYHLTKLYDGKHFYKKIRIGEEGLDGPLEYTEKIAALTLDDFSPMLSRHGFLIEEVFGDYQLAPFERDKSPRLLMIARRKD